MIRASAPGKLVLMGEYAVLAGQPAIVAAVDVRAECVREGGPLEIARDEDGLIAACLQIAATATAEIDGRIDVDTEAFRAGGIKYGLGSSAAACVALLRALLPNLQLDQLHDLAQRAHRKFQRGKGSGVDVCASVFGGIQRFVRRDDDVTEVKALPPLPDGVALLPVWTGISADTRAYLASIERAFGESSPFMAGGSHEIDRILRQLGAASQEFQLATFPEDLFVAVDEAHDALRRLGELAGANIVSAQHSAIATIARACGGAAKPSGAGGGDISLCFVGEPEARDCTQRLETAGFRVLDLVVGAPGVDVVGDGA
ncbi:MAG: hypothetical protein Q8O67_20560 [Deltaproteobacteria bacterium]|nr:hypothetical protein [Deltaproteobacteria bacterium]